MVLTVFPITAPTRPFLLRRPMTWVTLSSRMDVILTAIRVESYHD